MVHWLEDVFLVGVETICKWHTIHRQTLGSVRSIVRKRPRQGGAWATWIGSAFAGVLASPLGHCGLGRPTFGRICSDSLLSGTFGRPRGFRASTRREAAGSKTEIRDVAADKGYQTTNTLNELDEHVNYRTYIPEPKLPCGRNWSKVTRKERNAVLANRRRAKGNKGRKHQRMRSEKVERTFAHVL